MKYLIIVFVLLFVTCQPRERVSINKVEQENYHVQVLDSIDSTRLLIGLNKAHYIRGDNIKFRVVVDTDICLSQVRMNGRPMTQKARGIFEDDRQASTEGIKRVFFEVFDCDTNSMGVRSLDYLVGESLFPVLKNGEYLYRGIRNEINLKNIKSSSAGPTISCDSCLLYVKGSGVFDLEVKKGATKVEITYAQPGETEKTLLYQVVGLPDPVLKYSDHKNGSICLTAVSSIITGQEIECEVLNHYGQDSKMMERNKTLCFDLDQLKELKFVTCKCPGEDEARKVYNIKYGI